MIRNVVDNIINVDNIFDNLLQIYYWPIATAAMFTNLKIAKNKNIMQYIII